MHNKKLQYVVSLLALGAAVAACAPAPQSAQINPTTGPIRVAKPGEALNPMTTVTASLGFKDRFRTKAAEFVDTVDVTAGTGNWSLTIVADLGDPTTASWNYDAAPALATATRLADDTNANGQVTFTNIPPGNYRAVGRVTAVNATTTRPAPWVKPWPTWDLNGGSPGNGDFVVSGLVTVAFNAAPTGTFNVNIPLVDGTNDNLNTSVTFTPGVDPGTTIGKADL